MPAPLPRPIYLLPSVYRPIPPTSVSLGCSSRVKRPGRGVGECQRAGWLHQEWQHCASKLMGRGLLSLAWHLEAFLQGHGNMRDGGWLLATKVGIGDLERYT